jgi:tRNA pseudouridine32 synthase/23S rRNA pseudouridine746 synthase
MGSPAPQFAALRENCAKARVSYLHRDLHQQDEPAFPLPLYCAIHYIAGHTGAARGRPGHAMRAARLTERHGRPALKAPLPMRDGVTPSYIWVSEKGWRTMLEFLVARFPDVRTEDWVSRMARGDVVDADGRALQPASPCPLHTCVYYYRELPRETPIPFRETILYRDAHIVVADKPHFLPVIPSGRFLQETLLVRLKRTTGLEHLTPIHRLDRETAGIVIFSCDPATRGLYQSLFQRREMQKVYEALAPVLPGGRFPLVHRSRLVEGTPFFRMQEEDGEPNSETAIDIIEERDGMARYQLRPLTGKKHQLRVHMAALGIPILNDAFYPTALPCKEDDVSSPLQLLARSIAFADPLNGAAHRYDSLLQLSFPLPPGPA